MTDICEKCGAEIRVGSFPFCPHGDTKLATIPDDVPGGFWRENGFESPRWFPSHSAHRAALKAEGCQIAAKWAGPGDKYLKRWDVPSAKTLEDAKVLLSRGKTRTPEPTFVPDPITVREMPGPWPDGVPRG